MAKKKTTRRASKKAPARKKAAKKSSKKPATRKKAASRRKTSTRRRAADPGVARAKEPVTAEDARLVLELYDLRREEVMRRSRDTLLRWRPASLEELVEMSDITHPENAALRQVASYFELAFGLARKGAAHPELVAEWCGEGLLLYAKVEPFLDDFRAQVSPTAFQNAQWVAENTEWGRERVAFFRARLG